MPDVAEIAGRLSEAQRRAVANAFVVQGQASYRNGKMATQAHGTVLYNLCRLGLLADYRGQPLLTETGLAVRAYLENSREQ